MSLYELYRCIREDGTSKDWAVRINPDGSITTRWGRTGKKLINIQTRKVNLIALKRSKSKKGYIWMGTCEIDGLGQIVPEGRSNNLPEVRIEKPVFRWQLALGARCNSDELDAWEEGVLQTLKTSGVELDAEQLPDNHQSGAGVIGCDDLARLLGLLLLKQRTPLDVRFTLRMGNHQEVGPDLQDVAQLLEPLGTDLPTIRPLAESLGLLAPRIDLRMAIISDRNCWL